jgi:hypothetical protein
MHSSAADICQAGGGFARRDGGATIAGWSNRTRFPAKDPGEMSPLQIYLEFVLRFIAGLVLLNHEVR